MTLVLGHSTSSLACCFWAGLLPSLKPFFLSSWSEGLPCLPSALIYFYSTYFMCGCSFDHTENGRCGYRQGLHWRKGRGSMVFCFSWGKALTKYTVDQLWLILKDKVQPRWTSVTLPLSGTLQPGEFRDSWPFLFREVLKLPFTFFIYRMFVLIYSTHCGLKKTAKIEYWLLSENVYKLCIVQY